MALVKKLMYGNTKIEIYDDSCYKNRKEIDDALERIAIAVQPVLVAQEQKILNKATK